MYALSFFLIPALRWVSNAAKNRVIEGRNDSRAAAAKALRTPSPVLQRKLDRCSPAPSGCLLPLLLVAGNEVKMM